MQHSKIHQAVREVFAAILGAAPLLVAAQVTPPAPQPDPPAGAESLGRVEVTGIRGSLAKSVDAKRSADSVIDSIAAEDLGKFPQQNMAESLQRISGVQIQRSKGEGQSVSVRGLDPKFTQVLYNGRQLPSASGSRSFDFTILSADFVSALDVYKSATPEIRDGGLSATVNVRTPNPLAFKERRVVFTAEALHEDTAKATTPHVTGFYSDILADNRLGIALGIDYSKRKVAVERYEAFGFEPASVHANDPNDPRNTSAFNHAANFGEDIGQRERSSLMGAVSYKASDNLELRADVLASRFKNDLMTPLNSHRFTNVTGLATSGVLDDANKLISYGATGVDNRNNARTNVFEENLRSVAVGANYGLGDLTVDGELSTARARRLTSALSLEVIGRADATYDYRTDRSGIPSLTYGPGYDQTAPGVFRAIGFNGALDQPTTDTTKDGRLDFTYQVNQGWLRQIVTGVAVGERRHQVEARNLSVSAQALAQRLGVPYSPTIEGGSFDATPWMRPFGGSDFLSGYGGGSSFPRQWLSADPYAFLGQVPISELASIGSIDRPLTSIGDVRERTQALYAKAEFEWPAAAISGNVGLRYVRTNQSTLGYAPDLTDITFDQGGAVTIVPNAVEQNVSRTYSNVLPSFNLLWKAAPDLQLRLGAGRVLSRPDLDKATPTTTVNANVRTINSGNADLKPYLADQIDATAEWYFNRESLLSLSLFTKNLKNFIVSGTSTETLLVKQANGAPPVSTVFTRFKPVNGTDARMNGFEVSYQQPFTFLPSPFNGLGAIANLTYINAAKLATEEGGEKKTLPGVSKKSWNLTGYYEHEGFGAYLSYNYRDGFRLDADNYFGDGSNIKSYGQFDLSLSYKLSKRLSLTGAVINVTNEAVQAINDSGYGRGYEFGGRRFTAGLRLDL